MTPELIIYVLLISVAFFLSFFRIKKEELLVLSLLIGYSLVVRISGFDKDMKVYANTLNYPLEMMLINPYFLKEFGYWGGSRLLNTIIKNEIITLIFIDTLAYFAAYSVAKKNKLGGYFVIVFFLFFPSLLGMQNVYRQFLAAIVLLCAINTNVKKRNIKKYFLFFFAGFIHNLAFLFLPIAFLERKNKFLFITSMIIVLSLLPFVVGEKSYSNTGLSLIYLYLIVSFAILVTVLGLNRFVITRKNKTVIYLIVFCVLLLTVASRTLGEAQAERLGMVTYQISIPYLFITLENKIKQTSLIRIILIIILILPTFLFSNALSMLLT